MDLSRPVGYRGVELNDAVLDATLKCLLGNKVTEARFLPVKGVGYKEKRAQADGMDASDVYLAERVLVIRGETYGKNKGDTFDRLQNVLVALTPTAAYAEDPGAQGYLPLDFYVPSDDAANFPSGEKHQMLNVRPADLPGRAFDADKANTGPADPYTLNWEAVLEAVDPRIYAYDWTEVILTTGSNPSVGATNWTNKGNYPAPINFLLNVAANAGASAKFHFEGGGSNLDIAIPVEGSAQVLRYDSARKFLSQEINGTEVSRLDLLTLNAQTTHPLVPRGTSSYQYAVTGNATIQTGSRFWFYEAWA